MLLTLRPSRNAVPFPSVDVTPRRLTVRAKQEECPPAIAGQRPPHDTQNCGALIGALQLHVIVAFSTTRDKVRQPHNFHDLAIVSVILPDHRDNVAQARPG